MFVETFRNMAILTSKKALKEKRNAKIKKEYDNYMSWEGSQKYGAYEALALKYNVSAATVGRIVGNIKRKESGNV